MWASQCRSTQMSWIDISRPRYVHTQRDRIDIDCKFCPTCVIAESLVPRESGAAGILHPAGRRHPYLRGYLAFHGGSWSFDYVQTLSRNGHRLLVVALAASRDETCCKGLLLNAYYSWITFCDGETRDFGWYVFKQNLLIVNFFACKWSSHQRLCVLCQRHSRKLIVLR